VQLLYRTDLDFNVRIYRYLGPLKKVSVEISDLKRSKCLIKNVWYKFFEFDSRKQPTGTGINRFFVSGKQHPSTTTNTTRSYLSTSLN